MRTVDEERAENSRCGARSHMRNLARHGIDFGRHHVARPVRHMGIRSTAPQPDTSKPARYHPKTPHLLRGKRIDFPNQVWSTDITYIPLGRGHACLSAIIDRHSRCMVGRGPCDTIEAGERVACTGRAFEDNGTPSICNSNQGSTHTAQVYVDCLAGASVRQGMDGVGRRADGVLIERWFRDLKHECIYQAEYKNMRELRHVIAQYVERYNFRRPRSSLDHCTPAE